MKTTLKLASPIKKFLEWKETSTIYVHWPYCLKRCAYCNFNKYIKENVNHKRMQDCLTTEIETLLKMTGVKKISSIFFGGGTPSLALPSTISSVIEKISTLTKLDSNAEITLECNPTQLESENLIDFQKAGVNRVSLGVQTLDDSSLKILGRTHSSKDSINTLAAASLLFPGKVSVDVIFGRPEQTLQLWKKELEKILTICDNHISLYQLTLERGTELFKSVQRNEVEMPDVHEVSDMYLFAVDFLEINSFRRYEASNFGKKDVESKHNLSYWDGTQYIGIGPGAHGRFQCLDSVALREARIQTLEPDVWMTEVERKGHGTRKVLPQNVPTILEELLMTSMRTTYGLKNERWKLFSNGTSISEVFSSWPAFQKMSEDGFCFLLNGDLLPTRKGITFADTITTNLLPAIQKYFERENCRTGNYNGFHN